MLEISINPRYHLWHANPSIKENPYNLQQDREARPTENVNNQDEDTLIWNTIKLTEWTTRFAKTTF